MDVLPSARTARRTVLPCTEYVCYGLPSADVLQTFQSHSPGTRWLPNPIRSVSRGLFDAPDFQIPSLSIASDPATPSPVKWDTPGSFFPKHPTDAVDRTEKSSKRPHNLPCTATIRPRKGQPACAVCNTTSSSQCPPNRLPDPAERFEPFSSVPMEQRRVLPCHEAGYGKALESPVEQQDLNAVLV